MTNADVAGTPEHVAAALLASGSDAILAADPAGTICFWNPGAERIFGFSADEALGQSLDIIIPEKLQSRHWEGWTKTIETGQSRYGAGELLSGPAVTADGDRISVEFTIVLMNDQEGRLTGIVATLRDVSAHFEELRELKRRLAKS